MPPCVASLRKCRATTSRAIRAGRRPRAWLWDCRSPPRRSRRRRPRRATVDWRRPQRCSSRVDRAVDVVLQFASDPGDERLAVAVAPERVAAFATQSRPRPSGEAWRSTPTSRWSSVATRTSSRRCCDAPTARSTAAARCSSAPDASQRPWGAVRHREPLNFLIVNTYPSNPARHGGGMRIQNLWGSMPADIGAHAVVLAHTDGGPALMPLTLARPGFEQHVPFWPSSAADRAAQRRNRHHLRRRRAGARGHRRRSVHAGAALGGRRRSERARAGPSVHGPSGARRGPAPRSSTRPRTSRPTSRHRCSATTRPAAGDRARHPARGRSVRARQPRGLLHRRGPTAADRALRRRTRARPRDPQRRPVASMVFTPWPKRDLTAPRCVFAGSGHAPNVEAAAIIIEAARRCPTSASTSSVTWPASSDTGLPANVRCTGASPTPKSSGCSRGPRWR